MSEQLFSREDTDHLTRAAALLPAGIFSCNAEGLITFFNRRAAELWGRTPALNESLQHFYSFYKIYIADGTPVAPEQTPMLKAIKEGRAYRDVEAVFWRPDGSRFVVSISIDPVYDANGKLCGAINVFQDITHRKETEEALHRSEERFRTLANHAPVGIFMTDLEGNTLSVNDHWCHMTGVNAEEARNHGWMRALHADDHDRISNGWKNAMHNQSSSEAEFRFRRNNGDVIWVQGRAVPLRDGKGRHVGYIGTIADVTERKLTEHAARRLAAIVESSEDAIISKDLNGIIASWNRGAERIFGYSAEEAIGKSIASLIPPDRLEEESHILGKIRRGESMEHYETVRRRKCGRLIDISLTISPIKDAAGRVVGASKIAREITDKKRAEERQHVLYELVAGMNRGMDLPQLYDAALGAIMCCQDADRASILLYDSDQVMRFKAWRHLSDGYRAAVEGHSP
ncbi:MAG TPA: PAS domain S-box protein, partial [Desulfuromonadaceae bacterium]|nr:PAS domain S-box protein [Desulfuromonadaceae bacterium]